MNVFSVKYHQRWKSVTKGKKRPSYSWDETSSRIIAIDGMAAIAKAKKHSLRESYSYKDEDTGERVKQTVVGFKLTSVVHVVEVDF